MTELLPAWVWPPLLLLLPALWGLLVARAALWVGQHLQPPSPAAGTEVPPEDLPVPVYYI